MRTEILRAKNPDDDSSPGITLAVLLSLLYLLLFFPANALLSHFGNFGLFLDNASLFVVSQLIVWPMILWVGLYTAKKSWSQCYPLRPVRVAILFPLLISSVGATVLLLELASVIPISDAVKETFTEALSGDRVMFFLGVVVIAPFAEEYFFRGWMFQSFLRRYSLRKAVLASAALFAIVHLNPWQAVVAFPLGIFYAWLFIKTNSLSLSILSHATVNATTNYLLSPALELMGFSSEVFAEMDHFPLTLIVFGLVLTVTGILVLYRNFSQGTGGLWQAAEPFARADGRRRRSPSGR